jgi:Txe/YoeB family toxin of Txe-Axe toxin-antitoxin module
MLDMIIASLKSDMAYLTQTIRQMDDKAKKKVEELLQIAERDKLSIPENVRLFIDLYYQAHPTSKSLCSNR